MGHHLWRSHLNDLSIIKNRLLETVEKLCAIESFADVERLLLRGQGLSAATYQSYLTAVKQMYAHTDGLNPLQWTPADIESFYDALRARVGISTAAARIAGLRNFCRQVATQMVGAWESPFDIMGERLKAKLNASGKGKQKQAMSRDEIRSVIAYLNADTSVAGLQNRAAVLTLITTGLRAQEACDLTYESLEHDSDAGAWFVTGVGKGSKAFREEIHPEAVCAVRLAFKAQYKRDLRPGDYLLHSAGGRLRKSTLWVRLNTIGEELKRQGVVRQSIEFSAHLFRRSFLTQLSKAGMSVRALQHHSRHANVETLMSHYVDDHESTKPYLDEILSFAV